MSTSQSLTQDLLSQLQGQPLEQIASQLGTNSQQAGQAVATALPLLLGALGKNASEQQGADALFGALQRDFSPSSEGAGNAQQGGALGALDLGSLGGLGGILGSVLGGSGASAGGSGAGNAGAILGHIFGDKQGRAESGLGQATGLGDNAGNLLKILAPIVMAFLAQRVNSQGLDSNGLGAALGQEHAQVRQAGGQGGDLLTSVLDQDGDGRLGLGDLLKFGTSLLGGKR